jgi:gamma-glutamyltranspeptidase
VVLWSRKANGETGADYREKAPLAATKDMFLDKGGNVIEGKVQRPHLHPEFLNSCWFICCP